MSRVVLLAACALGALSVAVFAAHDWLRIAAILILAAIAALTLRRPRSG